MNSNLFNVWLEEPGNHLGASLTFLGPIVDEHTCNQVDFIPIARCEMFTYRFTGQINHIVTCGACGETWKVVYCPEEEACFVEAVSKDKLLDAWEGRLYDKRN